MLRDGIAGRAALAAVVAALPAPAAAQAAGKPVVTTGAAANVAQQSVDLTGTVAPNGAPTTYYFQYGATVVYGSTTPATAVNRQDARERGRLRVGARDDVSLSTRGPERARAHGRQGPRGQDAAPAARRDARGHAQPGAVGSRDDLAGTLSGTGNANRAVVLQANPFPYTQGFANAANAQLTNAQGGFSFPL